MKSKEIRVQFSRAAEVDAVIYKHEKYWVHVVCKQSFPGIWNLYIGQLISCNWVTHNTSHRWPYIWSTLHKWASSFHRLISFPLINSHIITVTSTIELTCKYHQIMCKSPRGDVITMERCGNLQIWIIGKCDWGVISCVTVSVTPGLHWYAWDLWQIWMAMAVDECR